MFFRPASALSGLLVLLARTAAAQSSPSAEQVEFFESMVRPVFVEHCYKCHSEKAEKIKGGLRLDSTDAVLTGGSSGPAIVPGNPNASLLIKAVRYTDPELQMPPKDKKLPDAQIASLETWVKMGAPMPKTASAGPPSLKDVNEARARHWAFQPIKEPAIPVVKNSRWVQTPIDNFVLAELEKQHLQPAPSVDRRTLIRRVSYDLLGLPPTWDEVEAFVRDERPDAYRRLVERLLSSPHYGERWGRYWLDVARYADTKGYLAGGEERRYAFSFTYRDYVVRSFNEDKPYDQFVKEQIAADLLEENQRNLAALGFLTLGRRFLGNQNDIIDDRIDVVTRGVLGLTVACARCHDHKFDPISTKDYYALHGIFASSEEPSELPLLEPTTDSPDHQAYLKEKAKIENEITDFKSGEITKFLTELREHVGDYLLAARDAAKLGDEKFETFAGERKVNATVLRRWMAVLESPKTKAAPVLTPWFKLSQLDEAEFSRNAKDAIANLGSEADHANRLVVAALAAETNLTLKAVASSYSKLFKQTDEEWKAALASAAKTNKAAPTGLPDPEKEALRQVLYAEGAPVNLPKADAENILSRKLNEGSAPYRNRIEALSWSHAGAPRRAMALADAANPHNSHVLVRGNPSTPGDEVPRRFLEVLARADAAPCTNGSGRLELARAIASADNPLTARVYVNRVWLHHFGEPLVSTPGDFGVRTELPVHRALLDYLASSLIKSGWSTKALHRMILLSATYQQSSDASPASLKADPDNRLISRMNRQRLDFEALRDTLLADSGKLDLTLGGLPVQLESEPFSGRRTLYGYIDRQNLPGLFRTFDFANPDTSSQGRFHTTVPQQALFLLNSPFVLEQARALADRAKASCGGGQPEQIQALYRLALQRPASRGEIELAEKFIAGQGSTKAVNISPLAKYAQILLLSNELVFVD
jgi:hypothetical protein